MITPHPRLTIGIPTFDRPDRLAMAVASALAQQVPAIVLVADQTGRAADVARAHAGHPLFRYVKTDASCLWENWTAAATACDSEFFCWLQDDDLVAPHLARRVVSAFDRYPTARVYLARLGLSFIGGEGNWWQSTGPMVPMNLIHGVPSLVRGSLIVAGGYFHSWALSPGMAFRWSLDAVEAIRRCPRDCDLYNERLVVAEICGQADAVCDPAMVGYWVQHDGNESKRQVRAGQRGPQYQVLVDHIDRLLIGRDDWREALSGWALLLGPSVLRDWLRETNDEMVSSPTFDEARGLLLDVLKLWGELDPKPTPENLEAKSGSSGTSESRGRRRRREARCAND